MGLYDFLSQAGQGFNSALTQAQNPFGLAPPPGMSPEMASGMPYVELGANMLANSHQRPMQALGGAFRDMKQQGLENSTKRLWAQQVQSQMQDAQEERENRKKMTAQLQALLQGGGMPGAAPMEAMGPLPNQPGATPDTPPTFAPAQAGGGGQPGMEFSPAQRFQAQYWLGAGDPEKAMTALFNAKGKTPFQTREVNGRIYAFDPETGTLGQDLGAAGSKQQTVPAAIQGDVIKAKQSYATLDKELADYEKLVERSGYTFVPGQETDAVAQKRRNIQLQLKELYNLGVLNGPDLDLMNQMLYDPSGLNPDNWGAMAGQLFGAEGADPASRAKASSGNLRQMMKTIVDNKIAQANEAGGSYAPMPGGAETAPPDVDPNVWEHMTPEERALWQQN